MNPIQGKDLLRKLKDEMRAGKHDEFLIANYGKFCLTILQAELRENGKIGEGEKKSFAPLSINP